MKTYEGKTVDEALSNACLDLGVALDDLHYEIIEEKEDYFQRKLLLNVM